jgi:hypothetical protein
MGLGTCEIAVRPVPAERIGRLASHALPRPAFRYPSTSYERFLLLSLYYHGYCR